MVVKDFVFEQNIALNRQRLFNKIDPYFSNVRKNGGLQNYYIDFSDQRNGPQALDALQMRGVIHVKPTGVFEYIPIEFNIVSSGGQMPN